MATNTVIAMVSVAARKRKKEATVGAANSQAEPQAPSRNLSVYFAVGVLVIVVAACYVNALRDGFVFDDHSHALSNPLFRSLANLPTIITNGYRPLRDVSYTIDFALWGEKAFGFHLTSILIHLANTLLVFWLMRRIIGDVIPSAFASLIFAVHPLQADAVTYISGRRDVLFSLFYLLSFHSYLSYRKRREKADPPRFDWRSLGLLALFIGCWGLSLMSKEMAASLPAFVFVWSFCDVWRHQDSNVVHRVWNAFKSALLRDKWFYAVVALAVPAYVWIQVVVKGGSERIQHGGLQYWGGSFYTNMLTVFRVHAWYLKQLVFPTPIVQYSGGFDVSTTIFEWRAILSIIVVTATLISGFVLLNKDRRLAFGILSYFALLLPVSQILPHHELLADHYLYLPMMSFGLVLALVAQKIIAMGRLPRLATLGAGAAIIITFGVMLFFRNFVYESDFSLWKQNYVEVPTSIRAASSLASQYATRYPSRGAELYKRCIELDPSYAGAYVSLAALYQTKEKAQEAEEIIKKGLEMPDSGIKAPSYGNPNRFRSELTTALAISKGFEGQGREAEELLLKAIELYPSSPQPYTLLTTYYHNTDRDKELELLKRRVLVFPTEQDALVSISYRLIGDKNYDEAIPYLNTMLAMNPNGFYANYQMGQIYRTKNDCDSAMKHLNIARRAASNPEDLKTVTDAITGTQQQCGLAPEKGQPGSK